MLHNLPLFYPPPTSRRTSLTPASLSWGQSLLLALVLFLPLVGSAQTGAALNFDGTNDYVELQNSASLQSYVTTGELTLEFWIRPEAGQTDYTPISNRIGSNNQGFVIEYYGGILHTWTRYGNAWIDTPVPLTSGIWQHVAIVANSMSGSETYVNGILANSTAASGAFSSPNVNMRLGGDVGSPGARIFGGDMDEVRIWNRALCAAEIDIQKDCELAGNESGLVAYYQFNQGNAGADNSAVTTLTDHTVNGNDGTLVNFDDLATGGSTSNWIAPGGVTSGTVCGPGNLPEITVNDDLANTDFGDVIINTTSDLSFIITNDGTADLDVSSISLDNGLFTVPATATTIAPGATLDFTVSFAPTSTGTTSGTVSIQSNDCDEDPYTFIVTGQGIPACDATITNVTPADESCPGTNDGTITVTATCTTCSSIQYSINGVDYQSSNVFADVAPGTYTVTIQDAGDTSCNATSSATVAEAVDTDAPTLDNGCPATASITLNLCDEISITPTDLGLAATDNCVAEPSISLSQTDFTGVGTTNVTVTLSDGTNSDNSCVIAITTVENPDAFVITAGADDLGTECPSAPFTFSAATLLTNDNISNGSTLEVQEVNLVNATDGSLTDNGNGTFTFTPATGFQGTVNMTYVVKTEGDNLFFADNGHFYQFVAASQILWTNARDDAEAMTLNGQTGYLATVTSQAENDFIATKLNGNGWMGATDTDVEGEWRWVTGPEAGQQFWQGSGGGSATGGAYENWSAGEPNNLGNEDYGHFLSNGSWNDYPLPGGIIAGYVVEYGDNSACVPNLTATGNITLLIEDNEAPAMPTLADLTGECAATTTAPTTTDNCAGTIIGTTTDPRTYTNQGTHTIEWTFDDGNGNVITAIQNVIIEDVTAPTAACSLPFTINLDANQTASVDAAAINNGSSDNCGTANVSITSGQTAYTCTDLGQTYEVTLTVSDGNATSADATCMTMVTVGDADSNCNAAPVANCQDLTLIANDDCEGFAVAIDFDDDLNPSFDPDGTALTYSVFPEGPYTDEETVVELTVSDGEASSSCFSTVTLLDQTPPTVTCQPDMIVELSSTQCSPLAINHSSPVAADNCTLASFNFFNSNEPNDAGEEPNSEAYIEILADGSWNDLPNNFSRNGIVEFESITNTVFPGYFKLGDFAGHSYYLANDAASWTISRFYAQSIGGDLVSINSQLENDFLNDINVLGWTGGFQDANDPFYVEPGDESQDFGGWFFTDGTRLGSSGIDFEQTEGPPSGSLFPIGDTPISWTATDDAGNTASCTFTITVIDNVGPQVAELLDIVNDCEVTVPVPTSTDPCLGTITGTTDDPLVYSTGGEYVVEWSFSDNNGNVTVVPQNIIVYDLLPPENDEIVVSCSEGNDGTITILTDYATSNPATNNGPPGPPPPPGGTPPPPPGGNPPPPPGGNPPPPPGGNPPTQSASSVEFSFDGGLTWATENTVMGLAPGTYLIGVRSTRNDDCQTEFIEVTVEACCDATITGVAATDEDCPGANDGIITVTATCSTCTSILYSINGVDYQSSNVFENVAPGTYTVTIQDSGDNSCNTTTSVTVNAGIDSEAPLVPVLADLTGECEATATAPTTTDNCSGTITGTTTDPLTYTDQGTYTITWNFDDGNGNVTTANQTVIVDDVTAPAITCPTNITETATSAAGAMVTFVDPVGTDNCSGATTTQTAGLPNGSTFPIGTTTVEFTVTDIAGTATSCSFDVTVSGLAPMIECPANIVVDTDPGVCEAIVAYEATETVGIPASTITYSIAPGSVFAVGAAVEVTATATNAVGTDACSFFVTVEDNEAPVVSCNDITVELDANGMATVVAADIASSTSTGTVTLYNGINYTGDSINLPIGVHDFPALNSTVGNDQTRSVRVYGDIYVELWNGYTPYNGQNPTLPVLTITQDNPNLNANYISSAAVFGNTIEGGSIDNCGIDSEVLNNSSFDCSNIGDNTVELTVTDLNGNVSTCTATVTVEDNTPPIVPAIANVTGECTTTVTTPTTTDNCAGTITGTTTDPLTYTDQGTYTITWTFDDGNDNVITADQIVIVDDVTAPAIACPANITETATSAAGAVVTFDDPVGTDNCSGANTTQTAGLPSGSIFPIGTTTVEFTVTDIAGTATSCSFDVTVSGLAPVIECPANIVVDTDPGVCEAIIVYEATETVGIPASTITYSIAPGSVFTVGAPVEVTAMATNTVGSDACSFFVTVEDNEAPTAECQPATVQLNANGNGSITTTDIDNGSSDACGIATLLVSQTDFGCENVGQNSVTLTVTDNNGNVSTCVTTVSVEDNVAPVAECQDITAQLDENGVVIITEDAVNNGSSDACGIASFDTDITSFDCSNIGANEVAMLVTDNNANASSCSATVTVEDNVAPIITNCSGADLTADAVTGDCSALVALPPVEFTDNCGNASVSVLCDAPGATILNNDFGLFPVGTSLVLCVVTDASGNADTCAFNVIVNDTQAPIITNCPSDITVDNDPGDCGADVFYGIITASDNCPGVTLDPVSQHMVDGDYFEVGTTNVLFVATDAVGLTTACSFTVTVNDANGPAFACPADITVDNDESECSAAIALPAITAVDDCGVADITVTAPGVELTDSTSVFPVGTTVVTYTATDVNGNQNSCSINVTVNDAEAPLLLNCPRDPITVSSSPDACGFNLDYDDITLDDNCPGGQITFASHDPTGDFFPVGLTVVTISASDAAGNATDCVFEVTVVDEVAPQPICTDTEVVLDANGQSTIAFWDVYAGANDNCGMAQTAPALSATSFGCADVGVQGVTVTVTDVNGNTGSCVAAVTVTDNTAPTALCADLTLELDANGVATLAATQIDGGSTDACGIAELSIDQTSFNCDAVGDNPVVLTVTDVNGNSANCTATVSVADNVVPTAICAEVITLALGNDGLATLTADQVNEGSSDACGLADLALDVTDFGCADVGENSVVMTVTDNNGNVNSCSTIVNVSDAVAPLAVCTDLSIELNAAGNASITASEVDGGSTDACGIASITADQTSFDCGQVGTNEVAVLVTDVNGNVSSCTATVTVEDNVAPLADCSDLDIDLDTQGNASITAAELNGFSSDACGIATLLASQTDFDCSHTGNNAVTLTVTDVNGNSTTCIANVNVNDVTSPTLVCQDITRSLDADGLATITAADVTDSVDDACGIAGVSIDNDSFNCASVESNNLVTVTATDVNGNTSSCLATVTVIDDLAPEANCSIKLVVMLSADGTATIIADSIDAGSTDNCGIVDYTLSQYSFDCDDLGQDSIYLTVTDAAGQSATCLTPISVIEVISPTAVCQDITVSLDASGTVTVNPAQINNGSTDGCGLADLELDQTFFNCGDLGVNPVVLTVADGSGNTQTCNATVTVEDNSAPILSCQDVTLPLDGETGSFNLIPQLVILEASDNCGTPQLDFSQTEFDCDDTGNNVITVTATDGAGNASSCTVNVAVYDFDAPTVVCNDITISLSADLGGVSITAEDIDGGSFDACGIASLSIDNGSFGCADVGPNSVQLTATDPSGNTGSCTATVTVVDDTAPTAICNDLSIELDGSGSATITAEDIDNGSGDACGIATLSVSQTDFDCSQTGENTVTLTVTDLSGNISSCTANVNVLDATAPTAICSDISIELDGSGNASINAEQIDNGSSDNCGISSISISQTEFGCAEMGEQSVILTVTDPSGLTDQCQAAVTVNDNVAPTVVCNDLTVELAANGQVDIVAADLDAGSTDACGIAELTIDLSNFGCEDAGANPVTLTATDANGNSASCTATVTVVDNIAPTAICSDLTVHLDGNGNADITVTDVDNSSFDNCDFSLSLSQTSFGYGDYPGTTTTLTVTDAAGNTDQCVANVTVEIECNNVYSGGTIASNEFGCGNYDPNVIISLNPASGGGNAPIEYLWLLTTDPELPVTQWTPAGNGETLDPSAISETTYYIRCARRLGCTEYTGETNVIAKVVNGYGEPCDPGEETQLVSGNAHDWDYNAGVSYANWLLGSADGAAAQFYQYNDRIRVELPDYLPAGSEVTITWKRRNYGGFYPARMLVFEQTAGQNAQLNDILYTQIKDFYISSTITLTEDNVRQLWIRNDWGYADFEVDAISYCATLCASNLTYCTPDDVSTEYEYIRRVKLGSIDNWTWSDNGYGDYTNLSTQLPLGGTSTIKLRPGFTGSSYIEYWSVWIDFDHDGEFETHEKVYQGRGRNQKTGQVYIPHWALPGEARMRVSMRYGGYPDPCEDGFEGEVEDYTVFIGNGGWFTPDNDVADNGRDTDTNTEEAEADLPHGDDQLRAERLEESTTTTAVSAPELTVYPNPTNGPTTVQFDGFDNGRATEIVISNLYGQRVFRQLLEPGANQLTIDPTQRGLSSGTYLITATNGEQRLTKQIVIIER